ncbi:substrate-binding periplasmic protein [Leucobacter sp. GX24907]
MSKSSKVILAIVAVIALAIGGGWLGARIQGGGGGGEAGASANGAWLDKIQSQGELRVGIASAPPMTGEQEDGQMGGPNVLPLEKLAEEMGVEFTPVAAEWSKMVSGLQADRFDVAAYLDATSERSLAIQFTDNVYTNEYVFIVPEASGMSTAEEIIEADKIAVATGTSYEPAVEALNVETLSVESIPQSIEVVKAGRANSAFGDLPTLAEAAKQNPDLKIVVPETPIFKSDTNYGVTADVDARSLQVLNIAIRSAQQDGSLQRAFDDAGVITLENLGDLEMK